MCSGHAKFKTIVKYFVLLSRNNLLMLKGLKSVDLRIIQMYNVSLPTKMENICGMHELAGL